MKDDEDAQIGLSETPRGLQEYMLMKKIKTRSRFIEKKKAALRFRSGPNLGQDTSQLDALPFTSGELVVRTVLKGKHVGLPHRFVRDPIVFSCFNSVVMGGSSHQDDIAHGEGEKQFRLLRQHGATAGQFAQLPLR